MQMYRDAKLVEGRTLTAHCTAQYRTPSYGLVMLLNSSWRMLSKPEAKAYLNPSVKCYGPSLQNRTGSLKDVHYPYSMEMIQASAGIISGMSCWKQAVAAQPHLTFTNHSETYNQRDQGEVIASPACGKEMREEGE